MKKIEILLEKTPTWVIAVAFFALVATVFITLKSCGALDHTSYLIGR